MPKKLIRLVTFLISAALLTATQLAPAQAQPAPYAVAAPLDQYLIADQSAEIALARSAAPASISGEAEILVLERDGYTTAVKGKNGFVCLVERSWGKSTDDAEFWNPKISAPHCLNAPAAKTYLPIYLMKTRLVLAAKSKAQITEALESAWDEHELPNLEPNAMCYMMSKDQYLQDDGGHWHPHMMWYVPGDAEKSWGANQAGVPAMAGYVPQDRMTVLMVVVNHWSDGTPATH
jgi:hypothetical protein